MKFALLKQNITKKILKILLLYFTLFAFVNNNNGLYAKNGNENPFHNYLIKQFQEKRFGGDLNKKVWKYLSNPSAGYKSAGLSSEEFAKLIREFVETVYSKKIIDSLIEVQKIDTRENLPEEKRSENISKYIKHIEAVANDFGLSVVNLDNKFLVVSSDGEQPPLGIVGKIKLSENYLRYEEVAYRDGNIFATPVLSSKTAVELAIFATGIINELKIKSHNRIMIFIDLSLTSQTNVDVLFNSYEIAPLNLVLDSYFPAVCVEYGYAMLRLMQTTKNLNENSYIKKIYADGGEYHIPINAYIQFDEKRLDIEIMKERINKFLAKYSKIDVVMENSQIRFSASNNIKGIQPNALDYLVLFLSENKDFYPENIKIFEYLRRNIILNPTGKSLGINKSHPLLKSTEIILKKVKIIDNTYSADIYIRFPYGIDSSFLVEKIKSNIALFNNKESIDIELYINAYNPITIDVNSDVAIRIRRAFKSVTGENDKCVTAEGLYTKLFPNSIGFGPDFGSSASLSSISQKDVLKITNIYITALLYLMER